MEPDHAQAPVRTRAARKLAAHMSWADTQDRTARTAVSNGRRAFNDKFLAEAGGDPVRAEHLRKAFFARLALKSAQARRANRAAARNGGGRDDG